MTPDSDSNSWPARVRRARADRAPDIDLAALLRAARAEAALPAPAPQTSFLGEFALLFATPRALWLAAAATVFAAYLGYATWQDFGSWADVAACTLGVAS